MELKITKERVLEAAEKCGAAKNVLKSLFPEVFEDDDFMKIPLVNHSHEIFPSGSPLVNIIQVAGGHYHEQGLWVSGDYEVVVVPYARGCTAARDAVCIRFKKKLGVI